MKSQSRSKSKARSQTGTSEKEHFFDNILDIDINKPKTAFNLFIRDISLKQENKGLNITELSKQFSEKFKRLSDREKRKYDELKDKDKERYENNLRLVKMYLVDPDKLKNSSTAYSLFKDAFIYEEINEKDSTYEEASKNAREAWEGLSKEEKDEWREKLREDQDITKELRHYKPGKVTAYMCFVQHQVNYEGLNLKEAREKWNKVSGKIRDKYEKQAVEQNKEKEKLRDLYEIAAGTKPKKPMGAYSIFLSELAASGTVNKKNFLNEGAKLWRELPDDEKEEYHRQHKILSLKYQIKKDYYNKINNDGRNGKVNGYNLFIRDKADEYRGKELKKGELFPLLNQEWKNLPESERNKYNRKAQEQNKLMGGLDRSQIIDDKPVRPTSAYNLFVKDKMIELKKDNAHKNKQQSDLMVLASQSWNNIHKSEKAKYEAKALQLKEDYNEKMVEYQKKLEEHDQTRGRKSQSKISNLIQTNLSKKSQSKSKLRSQNQTKEKEKPKEIIPKEEPKSDKEKEKKSFGKNKK